ncbi:hypothetical protein [Paenibacillus sp. HB172176]|uniref:hypothetical protein n=1 Tax=Paenibacillus sp. HB172176 TaxID=2493690 RepID=UPI00143AE543|nr:hypothetical protein [Paenibacillus sp. HB172176]
MKRNAKIILVLTIAFLVLGVSFMFYFFVGQKYAYAKKYANTLFEYEMPAATQVIEKDFDYGVFYGGGPWGSGGYPTMVAYIKISTQLSEKEVFEHYNKNGFEIYFKGTEELQKNDKGQIWYEGNIKNEDSLSTKENSKVPIEVIIQYRIEFTYPLFFDFN